MPTTMSKRSGKRTNRREAGPTPPKTSRRTSRRDRQAAGERKTADDQRQRLQKVLAAAGYGSRRECEELIVSGRVEVQGSVVDELGSKVDPAAEEIRVDGVRVNAPKLVYYMVNKPPGVVSTMRDPAGRERVVDLVPDSGQRIYNVGRLDKSSEGLILLTNDGELANRLTHPRYGVEKTYRVLVAGVPSPAALAKLRQGVHLAEAVAQVTRVKIVTRRKDSAVLEIVLDEGRNREIRRLLASLGHKVLRLKRIAIDGVRLGTMELGEWRPLRREEVRSLYQAARPNSRQKRKSARSKTSNRSGMRSPASKRRKRRP